ncbi:MAG: hypothetical protein AAGC55_16445, partial [Myxococcota bacterium]
MRALHDTRGLVCSVFLIFGLILTSVACEDSGTLMVHRLSRDKGVPGDMVRIYGSGFQASGAKQVRVFFGSKKAKFIRYEGDEVILLEVPGGHEFGTTVDVELVFEPGGSKKLEKAFKYAEIARLEVDDFQKKDEAGGAEKKKDKAGGAEKKKDEAGGAEKKK